MPATQLLQLFLLLSLITANRCLRIVSPQVQIKTIRKSSSQKQDLLLKSSTSGFQREREDTTGAAAGGREYLIVPFEEKDDAKNKGARWDPTARRWYITSFQPAEEFERWRLLHLQVPFAEKDAAKQLGAQWDAVAQRWCIPAALASKSSEAAAPFQRWMQLEQQQPQQQQQVTATTDADDYLLLLSVDTSGLPQRLESGDYAPITDMDRYSGSRVVQIACQLVRRSSWLVQAADCILLRADDFVIENSHLHGISQQQSLALGAPFVEAAHSRLLPLLKRAGCVVAHNAEFALLVLQSEAHRSGSSGDLLQRLQAMRVYCTMHHSKPLLALTDKNGNLKSPSLLELCNFAGVSATSTGTATSVAEDGGASKQQQQRVVDAMQRVEELRAALLSLSKRSLLTVDTIR